MTEQERKHLGNWSTNLPSPTYNELRMCLIGVFQLYGVSISVLDLLRLTEECLKDREDDTSLLLKKIGLYKGEYMEKTNINSMQEEKDREIPFIPKNSPS